MIVAILLVAGHEAAVQQSEASAHDCAPPSEFSPRAPPEDRLPIRNSLERRRQRLSTDFESDLTVAARGRAVGQGRPADKVGCSSRQVRQRRVRNECEDESFIR
jgi:hypothetical protein